MPMASRSFMSLGPQGFHRVAYREWGRPDDDRVLICIHGLSRNGRDFDGLAAAMEDEYRVIAVDMPGRGDSDRFEDKTGYDRPAYLAVLGALIARIGAAQIDWVGTSMGGRLGMYLAAQPNTPIRRLVLNDIGPHTPAEGRRHNSLNFGTDPRFDSLEEGIRTVRETRTAFGPMTDKQWEKFAVDSLRKLDDGRYTYHYDPGIAVVSKREPIQSSENWDVWERIACPVLTLWGTDSKLLLAEDVERMASTGPRTKVLEVPGVGHCPALVDDRQIGAIRDFLLS